jgi:hypothetical protein
MRHSKNRAPGQTRREAVGSLELKEMRRRLNWNVRYGVIGGPADLHFQSRDDARSDGFERWARRCPA